MLDSERSGFHFLDVRGTDDWLVFNSLELAEAVFIRRGGVFRNGVGDWIVDCRTIADARGRASRESQLCLGQ